MGKEGIVSEDFIYIWSKTNSFSLFHEANPDSPTAG